MKKHNVTIVVPIYKDWETLKLCINSLIKFVDKRHKILLVNDQSNEADLLEKNIIKAIKGYSNFQYFRNEENLGFLKTCNKAVFDYDKSDNDILLLNSDTEVTEGFLEEMINVLNLHEKHGAVSPRSNNSSLLSVPFKVDKDRSKIIKKSYECYKFIKDLLPQYTIAPTITGFCILIKRQLINNFGLFDEIYDKGYQEENDFCMRINKYGYSSVIANYAFIFHFESKSFGTNERFKRNKKNELILHDRFPYYPNIIYSYFTKDINPIDYFADVIYKDFYPKKRILFSLYGIPQAHNGTSKNAINILENFIKLYSDKYDIHILVHKDADNFYQFSERFPNVYYPETIRLNYHLAYVPYQIFYFEHLSILNKHALRIVSCMLDIISIRSNYLEMSNHQPIREITSLNLLYNDAITTISKFSENDIKRYFADNLIKIDNTKFNVIYCGVEKFSDNKKFTKPYDNYILVIGNKHYYHKALYDTFNLINESNTPNNFVFIGLDKPAYAKSNVKTYSSGKLTDEFVQFLYKNCSAVLFPSQYEGFGIPILEAFEAKKKIILFDNEINHEVIDNVVPKHNKDAIFFKTFAELKDIISKKIEYNDIKKQDEFRQWSVVAQETEKVINNLVNSEVDYKKLEQRWFTLNTIYTFNPAMANLKYYSVKELLELLSAKLKNNYNLLFLSINFLITLVPTIRFISTSPTKIKETLKKPNIFEVTTRKNKIVTFDRTILYEINKIEVTKDKIEIVGWVFDGNKKIKETKIIHIHNNSELHFNLEQNKVGEELFKKFVNKNSKYSGFYASSENSYGLKKRHLKLYFLLTYDNEVKVVPIKLTQGFLSKFFLI